MRFIHVRQRLSLRCFTITEGFDLSALQPQITMPDPVQHQLRRHIENTRCLVERDAIARAIKFGQIAIHLIVHSLSPSR